MTKIDVFSGFLGAGKTTLIKKLLGEAYVGEKVVLIENEFGEIGIDGGFLKEAGIEITEMNSGCICCSLVGDFEKALGEVLSRFEPDRILIEPSGVGKLSDVVGAVRGVLSDEVVLGSLVTVADATKCKIYMKNFGEFYNNQIENAGTIILSRTGGMSEDKLHKAISLLREHNDTAVIVTTPWEEIDGKQILAAMEGGKTLADELASLKAEAEHHHDHDGHECHDEHCSCHHHHHDHEHGEECHCHEHEHEHEHEHHHHHEHGEECHCHEHEHEHHHDHDHEHHGHHHHHHADEVFSTFGRETAKAFTKQGLEKALEALDSGKYGTVLRAKGIVAGEGGRWLHFDYVPEEASVREGGADVIGRLCIIGSGLDEDALAALFEV
ncbi:MAG: GTP-binding protein [Clostridia bacterium]|nr:GTP-binding protein [Clostridia bacterium]